MADLCADLVEDLREEGHRLRPSCEKAKSIRLMTCDHGVVWIVLIDAAGLAFAAAPLDTQGSETVANVADYFSRAALGIK